MIPECVLSSLALLQIYYNFILVCFEPRAQRRAFFVCFFKNIILQNYYKNKL